jgi:hypothetical protein
MPQSYRNRDKVPLHHASNCDHTSVPPYRAPREHETMDAIYGAHADYSRCSSCGWIGRLWKGTVRWRPPSGGLKINLLELDARVFNARPELT